MNVDRPLEKVVSLRYWVLDQNLFKVVTARQTGYNLLVPLHKVCENLGVLTP
jgi:hypothetical protein